MDKTMERRPLATRSNPLSIALASKLASIGATPNAISIVGMVAGILAGGVLAWTAQASQPWLVRFCWIAGAALVQFRLLCNMLDGMVAVESGQRTPTGELYNEIPDRVSDICTLVGLGYAAGSSPLAGYVTAICAVFVAYVRAAAKVAGAPQDYCGPMAKPHRMAAATALAVYCGAAPTAWQRAGTMGVAEIVLWVIVAGCAVTALRRLSHAAASLKAGWNKG